MNEQEFVYGKPGLMEKQQEVIDGLIKMQSHEYTSKQAKIVEAAEIAEKIALFKNLSKK